MDKEQDNNQTITLDIKKGFTKITTDQKIGQVKDGQISKGRA